MSDAKYQIKKVKPGVPDIMTLHEGSDTKLYSPSQGINVWAIRYGTYGMGHKYIFLSKLPVTEISGLLTLVEA